MLNLLGLGVSLLSGISIGGLKLTDLFNGVKFIGNVFSFLDDDKNIFKDPSSGGNVLGNLFNTLSGNTILSGIDLGSVLGGNSGTSTTSSNQFDLGDLFKGLGSNSSLSSLDLSSIFNTVSDTSTSKDFSIGDVFNDLSGLFSNLNLKDLFGGLDDSYYYVFSPLSVTNLFQNLSSNDILSRPAEKLDQIDLLDGLGTVLNTLGQGDLLKGLTVNDISRGNLTNDRLLGSGNNDALIGLDGNDRMAGSFGRDVVNGGTGDDRLLGADGDDILVGGAGKDWLIAGRGKDVLIGGDGADNLQGDRGNDVFVLNSKDSGIDVIRDFKRGLDSIGLTDNTSFKRLRITQKDEGALISLGKTSIAFVQGVEAKQLSASDFISFTQNSN
ncbi:MAG TPA: hypothetical protein V6D10_09710 [Trichocoleus sp.]|jgi:hypothetical protein